MTRKPAMPLLLVFVTMLLPACRDPEPDPMSDSTECEDGFILDGSSCVPESCGTGRWGNLSVDDDTVYVDVATEEGGDGTEAAPFTSIQDGLNRAGALGGGLVAVAAGTYPETLEFTTDHADVHLAGRCRGMVILDASVGDEETPGIRIDAGYGAVEVEGVTVRGSSYVGMLVASGDVTIWGARIIGSSSWGVDAYHPDLGGTTNLSVADCLIEKNSEVGVFAENPGTQITLRDTTVSGTQMDSNEEGWGIAVQDGATLSAEGCLISENSGIGLFASDAGTDVTLLETTLRDTLPNANGEGGQGIEVQDGATLFADSCLIEGNTELGLGAVAPDTQVTLWDTTLRNTYPANRVRGWGIAVQDGATLSAEGCLISENSEVGIGAANPGTHVTLQDTTVRDTQPNTNGGDGYGIAVQDGATLSAEGCLIDGNTALGLGAAEPGTHVTLQDTIVRDTQPNADGEYGLGISVLDGARLSAEGCLIDRNSNTGLLASNPGSQVTLRATTIRDMQPDENREGRGISVQDGARLFAEGCLIDGNADHGVYASGSGTNVTIWDSTISGTKPGTDSRASNASGVNVQAGAIVTASRLVVASNHGPGLVTNADGILECAECILEGNQFAGAVALSGGSLLISDSTIQGTTANVNLLGGAGVYAWPWLGDPPTVTIANTIIQDNPVAGVWLIGNGTYILTGNTISGGIGEPFGSGSRCGDAILARDGVSAWDGTSGLLLEDNEFLDASGSGIFLDDSSALMSGNSYSGNAMDLVVQNRSCDSLPVWYSEAPQHDLCPFYSYPTCDAEFFFEAMPAKTVDWEDNKAPSPWLLPLPLLPESPVRPIHPITPATRSDHPSHPLVLPR